MKDPINEELYAILACPKCKGPVTYTKDKTGLACKQCNKRYAIREGIPIMLTD